MTEEQRQFELGILIDLRTKLAAIEAVFADRDKLSPLPPSASVAYGELTIVTTDAGLISDAGAAFTTSFNTQLDTLLAASQTTRLTTPI